MGPAANIPSHISNDLRPYHAPSKETVQYLAEAVEAAKHISTYPRQLLFEKNTRSTFPAPAYYARTPQEPTPFSYIHLYACTRDTLPWARFINLAAHQINNFIQKRGKTLISFTLFHLRYYVNPVDTYALTSSANQPMTLTFAKAQSRAARTAYAFRNEKVGSLGVHLMLVLHLAPRDVNTHVNTWCPNNITECIHTHYMYLYV